MPYNLTETAIKQLTELRDKAVDAPTRKERAEAKRRIAPFLNSIKKCEYPKREGITLDAWCRTYLSVPLSTLHSARRSELYETFGFLRFILPSERQAVPHANNHHHDETGAL